MVFRSWVACIAMTSVLVSGGMIGAGAFDGYILAGGFEGGITALLDQNNDTIYKWDHTLQPCPKNGYSCYLMKNGNLLRSAQSTKTVASNAQPRQGVLNAIDPKGSIVWSYELATSTEMLHHDCKILPNGNILAVAFVHCTKAKAIEYGIDSSLFAGGMGMNNSIELEKIIEIKPDTTGGNNHQIVWEWKIWDHIIPKEQAAAHPEKFSSDLGPMWFGQWVHLNGLDYNPTKDLIVFSSRIFSEVFIIDHSTNTAEAATGTGGTYGKGGDLLYRWGHADNYGISETNEGKEIHTLHCTTWIPEGYQNAGDVMFYHNNATSNGYSFTKIGNSEVVEITPMDAAGVFNKNATGVFGPAAPSWIYAPSVTDSIYSMSMSSAIRMKNGNTIVHEAFTEAKSDTGGNQIPGMATYGTSRIREVKPDGTVVGEPFYLGVNAAKIMYYEKDAPQIQALFAHTGINQNKLGGTRVGATGTPVVMYANNLITVRNVAGAMVSLYSLQGKLMTVVKASSAVCSISTITFARGTYLLKVTGIPGMVTSRKINLL